MTKYLITDPKFYTNNPIKLYNKLSKIYKYYPISLSCFRDKTSKNKISLAKKFVLISKKHNIKNIAINGDIKLALRLKANCIHLNSKQFHLIKIARKNKLLCIISTHNEKEIKQALKDRADFITYSPIFNTPNKGEPKGIEKLKHVTKKYPIKIIALGGIVSKKHIKSLKQTRVKGFASIRYFL